MALESAVISAGALSSFAYGLARYGAGPQAGGLAFQALTLSQLLHALSCRSERHSLFDKGQLPPNRYLYLALGGTLFLQALTMIIPGLRRFLGLGAFGLVDTAVVGASSVVPLLINEVTKKNRQRMEA